MGKTSAAAKIKEAPVLTMNASDMRTLFAAALVWASTDDTRPHMTAIRLESDGKSVTIAATDGHGIWVCPSAPVTQPAPEFAQSIQASDAALICRCLPSKGEDFEVVVTLGDEPRIKIGRHTLDLQPDNEQFPPWRKAIAGAGAGDKRAACVGLGARNLARVSKSLSGNRRHAGVKMTTGASELDAVRFDGFVGEQVPAYVVLMPMRVGP